MLVQLLVQLITSYEQVVQRNGAELIIRTASNIQFMKNILDIIHKVNNTNKNIESKLLHILQNIIIWKHWCIEKCSQGYG